MLGMGDPTETDFFSKGILIYLHHKIIRIQIRSKIGKTMTILAPLWDSFLSNNEKGDLFFCDFYFIICVRRLQMSNRNFRRRRICFGRSLFGL